MLHVPFPLSLIPLQSLRVSNGLPAIGHPNFAPDKRSGFNSSLIDTQTGRGGGGFQKKPLVIDMAKIREKFNILGDRGGAVATQQQQPPPRRMVRFIAVCVRARMCSCVRVCLGWRRRRRNAGTTT